MSAAVTLERTHLRVITNSELSVRRACARKHHYQYRLLRRPRSQSAALGFGILWHVGMEAWWLESTAEARLEAALVAVRAVEGTDPYALVMAEELLLAYTARWGDEDIQTVAVEQEFRVPLVNPETGKASRTFELGGKFDGVVRIDAKQSVLEHKTTASDIEEGSLYWKKVQALDTQVSLYLSGARAAGYAVEDCLYDVVRKPGIRPFKATPAESRKYTAKGLLYANQREKDETPEEYRARIRADIGERTERYFARGSIVRLEADEKDHAYDMWQQARIMRESELAGFQPKNPDACSQYGGCPYLPVCSGEATIDDDALYRTAESAHEELTDE